MHELRFLGEVSLGVSPGAASRRLSRPRSISLLAVLAASDRGGVTRDRLIALLWEGVDETRARHSLSNQLHIVRRALGPDALLTPGDFVRLNPEAVWADVAEFRSALEANEMERAARSYGGPFLDGFHLDDAGEFEHWLDGERRVLATRALDVFEALADREMEAGNAGCAVKWLHRATRLDPWNSRAAVALARALAASGDPGNGVQHLIDHVRRLQEDLGLAPDPGILKLIESAEFGVSNGALGPRGEPVAAQVSAGVLPASGQVGSAPVGDVALPVSTGRSRRHRVLRPVAAVAGAAALVFGTGALVERVRGGEANRTDHLVVLPLRPVGLDSSAAALVTVRLHAELAEWDRYRARPQEETAALWSQIGGSPGGDPPADGIRHIALEMRAGKVLSGRVSSSEDGIEVTASLVSGPDGEILAEARASGSADSLGGIVHALVVRLAASEQGIPADRIATLARYDPAAVRLFIRAHPHESDERDRLLREAIARDSTFALAALELYESFPNNVMPDGDDPAAVAEAAAWAEVAALIWANRDRLSPADRAYAEARLGWRFDRAYTASTHVAAWERAVRVAPDRPAHWRGLFQECYNWCSSIRFRWEEPLLDVHDALLERGDTTFLEQAMEVAFAANDTARLRSYAGLLPDGPSYGRWLAAVGLGRTAARARIVEHIQAGGDFPLMLIGNAAILTGRGLEDAERAARVHRAGSVGSIYSLRPMVLARERGRHTEYRRMRDKLFQYFEVRSGTDALAAANVVFEWGYFGEPETDATLDAMDRMLTRIVDSGAHGSPDSLAVAHCYRGQLRLLRNDTTGVADGVLHLRSDPALSSLALSRMCAPFLDYLAARGRDRQAHAAAARQLHDVVRERPLTFGRGPGLFVLEMNLAASINLSLARSFGELGHPESGLQIARKRPYAAWLWGLYGFHVEFVREEARLLAQAGETEAALARYEKFFRLRPEPPDLDSWAAEWQAVRAEYEALQASAAG